MRIPTPVPVEALSEQPAGSLTFTKTARTLARARPPGSSSAPNATCFWSPVRSVPLEGLEPPTVSLGRNCSSIELQRLAASSLGGVAGSARPSGPERGNPLGMALVRLRASPTLGIVAGPKTATEGELPCSP